MQVSKIEDDRGKELAVPEMNSDVILSSVVLEHWEENIMWDESDIKPRPNTVQLVQK